MSFDKRGDIDFNAYKPVFQNLGMPFKIRREESSDYNLSLENTRKCFSEEKQMEIKKRLEMKPPTSYVPVVDVKSGFVPNVINFCVKDGLLGVEKVVVLPLNLFEMLKNNKPYLDSMYQSMNETYGSNNFLVNINEVTCKLYHIDFDKTNQCYTFKEAKTFHYEK